MNERLNDLLMETAILGEQADLFIKSDVGQYLLARSEEKSRICYEALKKVSPWRTRRIRDLQNEIWKCESFHLWLRQAITEGHSAREEILDR
jgi:hypothetical protein